jgi:hypothetical protein
MGKPPPPPCHLHMNQHLCGVQCDNDALLSTLCTRSTPCLGSMLTQAKSVTAGGPTCMCEMSAA